MARGVSGSTAEGALETGAGRPPSVSRRDAIPRQLSCRE
jgi:hypothetical protein